MVHDIHDPARYPQGDGLPYHTNLFVRTEIVLKPEIEVALKKICQGSTLNVC